MIACTGDTGPTPDVVDLARDADLFLAEATYVDHVPDDSRRYLSSARAVGKQAAHANVGYLLLTHLWPGTDPQDAQRAAATSGYDGHIGTAISDVMIDLT